jgi:tRNA A37 threonylcarbamoyladenosine synthetase subunit TsaC/SUA5/YrdC
VAERFTGRIDCILNAGECTAPMTSTVLSVLTDPYEVLREGTVPSAALKGMLREKLRG